MVVQFEYLLLELEGIVDHLLQSVPLVKVILKVL